MTFRHVKLAVLALAAVAAGTAASRAEIVFSVYGGYQGASDSNVSGSDPAGVGDFDFDQRWEGRSFDTPPYWGVRGTWWLDSHPNWGLAIDYSHSKVYADPLPEFWERLEFTDGLNLLTANALYRFSQDGRRWTPYVGLGAGLSIPHVEVQTTAASPQTFEYQAAGAAFQAMAGVDYAFSDWSSIFAEYKFNYAMNSVDLEGGGSLDTDIPVHAFNIGLSLHWKP